MVIQRSWGVKNHRNERVIIKKNACLLPIYFTLGEGKENLFNIYRVTLGKGILEISKYKMLYLVYALQSYPSTKKSSFQTENTHIKWSILILVIESNRNIVHRLLYRGNVTERSISAQWTPSVLLAVIIMLHIFNNNTFIAASVRQH